LVYHNGSGTFYLVVGQTFFGNYHSGPDFSEYTAQFRRFNLTVVQPDPSRPINLLFQYMSHVPTGDPNEPDSTKVLTYGWQYELHRRDLNVVPTITVDNLPGSGSPAPGFGLFGGVFDPITNAGFYTHPVFWNFNISQDPLLSGFHQMFNSYACATTSLFDPNTNLSHVIFYGGISGFVVSDSYEVLQYTNLFQVPWTKQITVVTTNATNPSFVEKSTDAPNPVSWGMHQYEICNLDTETLANTYTWGTEAKFIPAPDVPRVTLPGYGVIEEVLDLGAIRSKGKVLLGSIYGGIESRLTKPFGCTFANNLFYDVYLVNL
jgi:hypothetical protein